jgi:ADP-heptose:LPS heptosyltransferase
MRRIDRWVGVPVSAVLTLVRRLDDLILRRRPTTEPKRIAVLKLAEQGATVLAYPALSRACELVGKQNLFFVVFAENRFILDLMDVVPGENVLAIRTNGLVRTVLDILKVVVRMHRERIDATVDFEFFARSSAILSYLSGARSRVGFHAFAGEASYRGDLMTHRLSFNSFLHASQIFRVEVEALTMPAERFPACEMVPSDEVPLPVYRPQAKRIGEVETLLCTELGRDAVPPVILLNANCSDLLPLRRWEPERYVELAGRLLERYEDLAIVLTGSPGEASAAQDLVRRIGSSRCVSLSGKTTMDQLVTLYCLSELMITNDSGPAHYATLTSIDVIALFGPETPAVFGARTPRSHVLWSGIACSPCVNAFNDRRSSCKDNVCMQRIGVNEVFELACRVFEGRLERSSAGDQRRPAPESGQRFEVAGTVGRREPEIAVRCDVPRHDGQAEFPQE